MSGIKSVFTEKGNLIDHAKLSLDRNSYDNTTLDLVLTQNTRSVL